MSNHSTLNYRQRASQHSDSKLDALKKTMLYSGYAFQAQQRQTAKGKIETLLEQASIDDDQSLERLAQELRTLGYGEMHPTGERKEIQNVTPSVKSKLGEGLWAFIWPLAKDISCLDELRGTHVRVGETIYVIRGFEQEAQNAYMHNQEITFFCSPLS